MQRELRAALAAFLTDLGLYLLMLSLPFRAIEHGASSAVLGLVPFLYAGPYSVCALLAGRVSDRWARRGPIRTGLGLAAAAAVVLAEDLPLPAALGLVPFIGLGLGLFWPSLQAGISELREGRDLPRLTAMFNVAWSLGKGTGLLAGGLLLESRGPQGLALLAAIAWVLASVAVPAMARPGDHSASVDADPQRPHPARQRAFLHSAWVANGIAFGVVATLNHHLPRRLLAGGIGADVFGLFLGLVFFAQTFTFLALAPTRRWHYRALPLVLLQGVVAAAVIATPGARGLLPLLILAPIFGVGLGFAYQSSLYYSLHASAGRGKQAGVHEAMLGIASATVPVVGGVLALRLGDLAPFGVAATAVVASAAYASLQFRSSSLPR